MSVKSALLGVDFKRAALIYTAGEEIKGNINLAGGTRGIKLFDFKLTLIRHTDYTFYASHLEQKKSFYNLLATINSASVTTFNFPSFPLNISPSTTKSVPFSLSLPTSLWSTFVAPNAYTCYGLMLTGQAGSEYAKKEIFILRRDVVIIGNIPLPLGEKPMRKLAKYTSPDGEESKMMVKIVRPSATPGESLPFTVEVVNATKCGITGVKGVLQQNIGYYFKKKRCGGVVRSMKSNDARILWTGEGTPVQPLSKGIWSGEILVPYVVPTGLGVEQCPEFWLSYRLTFSLSQLVKMKVSVDIFIGTAVKRSGEGEGEGEEDDDGISLAYGSEVSKDSLLELDWDTISLSSTDSGVCWTIMDDAGSSKSK